MVVGHHDTNYLELYTGARMLTETDDCCPPETFTFAVQCEHIEPTGQCCYSDNQVHVWDVPTYTGCLHSVEDYASYVPVDNAMTWNTTNPEANTHVEVYASLHPNGCCECFMYALECSNDCSALFPPETTDPPATEESKNEFCWYCWLLFWLWF